MAENDVFIRTSDTEAGDFLRLLAEKDMRSMGNEVAWLIRQEYARRFVQAAAQVSAPKAEPVRK